MSSKSIEERLKQKAKTLPQWKEDRYLIITSEKLVKVTDVLALVKEEKQKLQQIIELLKEVAEKRGAYSQDQLTHAENCIENASKRAKEVIKILEEALK